MSETARHRVPRRTLAPALPTPPIGLDDGALDDCTIGSEMLADGTQPEIVQAAEQRQIRWEESRLGHVEVFRMGSVGTSILRGTSTPIRPTTRSTDYTLVREEPAILLSVVALAELLRDFGLTTAAARFADISSEAKSSLFWINTVGGMVAAGLVLAISPLVARVMGAEDLLQLFLWVSPVFLLNGMSAQFRAELNSHLQYGKLALVDTVPALAGLAAAIVLAIAQFGVHALIWQQIVVAALGFSMATTLSKWRPQFVFSFESARPYINYGGGLFGTQLIAYFTKNIDTFSLGVVAGPQAVGHYNRAFQLLMVPINQISAPLTRVAVPYLSRIAKSGPSIRNDLDSLVRVNLIALGSLYAVAFGASADLIPFVLGSQWQELVPIFQALAVGGVFKILSQVNFWSFLAEGKTTQQFRFYLWSQPLIMVAILAGLPWGAFGVAVGHSVGYGVNWLLSTYWASKHTDLDFGRTMRTSIRITCSLLVPLALVGLLATNYLDDRAITFTLIVVSTIVIAVSYFAVSSTDRVLLKNMLSSRGTK